MATSGISSFLNLADLLASCYCVAWPNTIDTLEMRIQKCMAIACSNYDIIAKRTFIVYADNIPGYNTANCRVAFRRDIKGLVKTIRTRCIESCAQCCMPRY